MIGNSIEDEIIIEIYGDVRKENPYLVNKNPEEYFRLCKKRYNEEHNLRFEARKKIKNRYSLELFLEGWFLKQIKDYKNFDKEEQRKKNREVVNKLALFFCGNKRMILDSYKIYWKLLRDYKKKLL